MTDETNNSMRLFFALWPDDETRTSLMELQQSMQGRRIPYSNLHLTLAFLGQQPASLLPALEDILTHLPPLAVTLRIDKLGYFSRNRIAWAGMYDVPVTLLTLHEELMHALVQQGVAFRNQGEFRPHITLARDAVLPADMVFDPIAWRADEIAIVKSVTNAEGAVYEVLASRKLDRRLWTRNETEGNAAARRG
jgi:RNA 2',3'-cyclic 3'-phosphodiesterase